MGAYFQISPLVSEVCRTEVLSKITPSSFEQIKDYKEYLNGEMKEVPFA